MEAKIQGKSSPKRRRESRKRQKQPLEQMSPGKDEYLVQFSLAGQNVKLQHMGHSLQYEYDEDKYT